MLFEFFRRVNGAQDLVKEFIGGLDLSPYFEKPFMRHVTVGTRSSNAGPVLEMNSLLHLLVWIVPHFVAGRTEILGICYLHDPIKTAPEQNSTNAADD